MLRRAREQKIFHETNTSPSLFPMREVNQQEGSDLLSKKHFQGRSSAKPIYFSMFASGSYKALRSSFMSSIRFSVYYKGKFIYGSLARK